MTKPLEGKRRWELKSRKEIEQFFVHMGCSQRDTTDNKTSFRVLARCELASSQLMDFAIAMGAKTTGHQSPVSEITADMHNIHIKWKPKKKDKSGQNKPKSKPAVAAG